MSCPRSSLDCVFPVLLQHDTVLLQHDQENQEIKTDHHGRLILGVSLRSANHFIMTSTANASSSNLCFLAFRDGDTSGHQRRTVILCNVPQYGFACWFFIIRSGLRIFGRNIAVMRQCSHYVLSGGAELRSVLLLMAGAAVTRRRW